MRPRTIAIIQARMGATRLPGKVLHDIAGQPMLVRVVERTRRASLLDGFVVATTTEVQDDALYELCRERGYSCYRGEQQDVLDRYYQAARQTGADVIVRITADCPVIDPLLINETVQLVTGHYSLVTDHFDFAANRLPPPWGRTYPIGLDVEACTFAALERAWQEATEPYQREHVMPYLYEGVNLQPATCNLQLATRNLQLGTSPSGFRVALLNHDPDYGALRWTVDTPEDLELIRLVYARFGGRDDFGWREILALFEREPELTKLNALINAKGMTESETK
ncbi:MAG: glycosyltransferase family protein [Anaerolineales bacterium]|nr:glycosyltransferase family protein [Anaerolineales bacterium]